MSTMYNIRVDIHGGHGNTHLMPDYHTGEFTDRNRSDIQAEQYTGVRGTGADTCGGYTRVHMGIQTSMGRSGEA